MPKGGLRNPKGGRPKGRRNNATISKEEAREACRLLIMEHFEPMIQSQVANSLGIKYLVVREKKSGKFVRVTEAMARAKAGDTEEIIEVWEKDPCVQSFTDLMNRAIDKPKEQKIEVEVSNLDTQVQNLKNGRLFEAKKKAERSKSPAK